MKELVEAAKLAFAENREVSGKVGQFEFRFNGFSSYRVFGSKSGYNDWGPCRKTDKNFTREDVLKATLLKLSKLESEPQTKHTIKWQSNDYENLEFTDWTEPRVLEAIRDRIAKLETLTGDKAEPEEIARLKRILPQVEWMQASNGVKEELQHQLL